MSEFEFNQGSSIEDVPSLARWLSNRQAALDLPVDRLIFLVSLVFLNQHQLDGVFEESTLVSCFFSCDEALLNREDTRLLRANQAINALVAQRLLIRFSDSLADIEAIYRLTPLGLAISEHYIHTQRWSSDSLAIQLQHVAQKIEEALQGSKDSITFQQWTTRVFVPLRYLVAEIFDKIDHAQRTLDLQQLETKEKISSLLHQRWDLALELCENLLSETSTVLERLKETLHAVGDHIQSGLMMIHASVEPHPDLMFICALVGDLQKKFDRILCWGERTIELWARYDRRVHKFLRTAIAIDKDRHFSESLRQSILEFLDHPWHLNITDSVKLIECAPDREEMYCVETIGSPNPLSQVLVNNKARDFKKIFQEWQVHCEGSLVGLDESLASFLQYGLQDALPDEAFIEANRLAQWWMTLGYSQKELEGQSVSWRVVIDRFIAIQAHTIDKFYEEP